MNLQDKFNKLEKLLLDSRDTLAQGAGVPFIRLIYKPNLEEECTYRRKTLFQVLKDRGIPVRTVSVKGVIFSYYEKENRLEDLFQLENEDGISDRLNRHLHKRSKEELVKRLKEAIEKLDSDGVIFLTDVAFAYPFLSISPVLEELTNQIKPPKALVIFYPGEIKNERFFFLGERESGYYRSRDIV